LHLAKRSEGPRERLMEHSGKPLLTEGGFVVFPTGNRQGDACTRSFEALLDGMYRTRTLAR